MPTLIVGLRGPAPYGRPCPRVEVVTDLEIIRRPNHWSGWVYVVDPLDGRTDD